jgi:hypothetical protein
MEGRQLRRNQFRSGKQIAKHYGDRPSKQALHHILRFQLEVPADIIGILPSFVSVL